MVKLGCIGVAGGDATLEILKSPVALESTESTKIALLGELARVYWERVLTNLLNYNGDGFEWMDLIQHENTPKERSCMASAQRILEDARPALADPVFRFIMEHGLPPPPSPPLTIKQVEQLSRDVRAFPFEPEDRYRQLAMDLCDVVDDRLDWWSIPVYEKVSNWRGHKPSVDISTNCLIKAVADQPLFPWQV